MMRLVSCPIMPLSLSLSAFIFFFSSFLLFHFFLFFFFLFMETSVFDEAAIARDAVQGQRQRQQLCVDPPPSPSSSAELCSDGLNAEAFLVDDYLDLSFVCYDTSDMTETLPAREGEEEREAISKEEEVSFIPAFDLCLPSDELVHQLEWLSNFVEDSFSTDQNDSAWPTPKAMDIVKKRPPSFIQEEEMEEEEDEEEEEEEEEEQDDTTSVIISSSLLIRACTVFSSSMLVMKRPCTPSSESSNGRDNNGNVLVGFDFNAKDTFSSLSSYRVLRKKKRGEGGEGGVLKRKLKMMMKTNKMKKKKKKKKKKDRNGKTSTSGAVAHRPTDNLASLPPRRCAHCQVHKTPQWRAGPMGPKTLCNACGVRYKSGRLLPEYRPAGSPTFITSLHSNSHQKILEMRRHYQVTSPHGRSSPDGTSTTTMETCTTTS